MSDQEPHPTVRTRTLFLSLLCICFTGLCMLWMESSYDPLDGVVHASRSLTTTLETWAERRKTERTQRGRGEPVVTTAAGEWGARTEVAEESKDDTAANGHIDDPNEGGEHEGATEKGSDSTPIAVDSSPFTAVPSASSDAHEAAGDVTSASWTYRSPGASTAAQAASTAAASTPVRGTATVTHQPQELRPYGKLKIYLLPLPGRFNFHLLQSEWANNPTSRVQLSCPHGFPSDWDLSRPAPSKSANSTFLMEDSDWTTSPVSVQLPAYPVAPLAYQHGAEYWLTLSLLSGSTHSAVRVRSASEADIVFVPAFLSLLGHMLQGKKAPDLKKWLFDLFDVLQKLQFSDGSSAWDWQLSRPRSPLFALPASRPDCLLPISTWLQSVRILAADFSFHANTSANSTKDVLVPYVAMSQPYAADPGSWDSRQNLLYFHGTLSAYNKGRDVRKDLQAALGSATDVQFSDRVHRTFPVTADDIRKMQEQMRNAKFCLVPEGDTSSSSRLFEAMMSGCVPVVVTYTSDYPFAHILDYSRFALFVPPVLAARPGFLPSLLRSSKKLWTHKWLEITKVRHHFVYGHPAFAEGAEDMTWTSLNVALQYGSEIQEAGYSKRILHKELVLLKAAGLGAQWLEERPRGDFSALQKSDDRLEHIEKVKERKRRRNRGSKSG